ncbi:MAG: hypothetical protein DDT22_00964 [candidate division WS2 bacterium]|nr:hypothetical protein [Candidatus Lithacetigena glycinireducens]
MVKESSHKILMHQGATYSRLNIGLMLFGFILLTHSMGAYQIAGIPVPWLSEVLAIILMLAIAYKSKLYHFPGDKIFIVLIGWLFLVTIGKEMFLGYSAMMPPRATTSYPVFIALRFLHLVSLLSFLFGIYWLLKRGNINLIISMVVIIGTALSLFALYVYAAQIFGLPEPSRTRMGTCGGEQSVVFTYAFHRAMGSFREPSHLALWLVVPFFLSFLTPQKLKGMLFSVLIGSVILLTGSLTGILSILIGSISAYILIGRYKLISIYKNFMMPLLVLFLGLGIFALVVHSYSESGVSLFNVIIERVRQIIEGGMTASNRGPVYKWVQSTTIPYLGHGLGNANIFYAHDINSDLMGSFLNLFITILFSGGYVGILLLFIFLMTPIYIVLKSGVARNSAENYYMFYVLSSYLAWIIIYFAHSEEVDLMFAIPYALLVFLSKSRKDIRL